MLDRVWRAPDGHKLWVGLWTPEAQHDYTRFHATQTLPPKPATIQVHFLHLHRLLSNAATTLWNTRSSTPLHPAFLEDLQHRYRRTQPQTPRKSPGSRPTVDRPRHSKLPLPHLVTRSTSALLSAIPQRGLITTFFTRTIPIANPYITPVHPHLPAGVG